MSTGGKHRLEGSTAMTRLCVLPSHVVGFRRLTSCKVRTDGQGLAAVRLPFELGPQAAARLGGRPQQQAQQGAQAGTPAEGQHQRQTADAER